MRTWYVFDVNETRGISFRTHHKPIARFVAWYMGRNFDYGTRKDAFPR